ncbi:MAG: CHY zinc finger protein, partial [Planctomycetota bacterium]
MPEGFTIRGVDVDEAGRCKHWHSERDVVAMKLGCCDDWWACIDCHRELAGHDVVRRDPTSDEPAAMCGICGHTMTAAAYFDYGDACPNCGHAFNPGCRLHRHLYFA